MQFGEMVEHARKRCREILGETIEARRNAGYKVYAEPAARNQNGEVVAAPDGLMLPLRWDLAYVGPDGKVQTECAESVALQCSEPIFATWEGKLRIEIRSLSWDYLTIRCPVDAAPEDWEPLRAWFLKWFDEADRFEADSDGLFGAVHFLSDPTCDGACIEFCVDLGSASSEGLGELFDAMIFMGFPHCILGRLAAEASGETGHAE